MGRLSDAVMLGGAYPASPGFKEGTTSRDAAKGLGDVSALRADVLKAIRDRPSTADEVATHLGLSVLTVRPRVSELRKQEKVRPHVGATGKAIRRNNESGAAATVWESCGEL